MKRATLKLMGLIGIGVIALRGFVTGRRRRSQSLPPMFSRESTKRLRSRFNAEKWNAADVDVTAPQPQRVAAPL